MGYVYRKPQGHACAKPFDNNVGDVWQCEVCLRYWITSRVFEWRETRWPLPIEPDIEHPEPQPNRLRRIINRGK